MIQRRQKTARGFIMISVLWMGLGLLLAVSSFMVETRLSALSVRAEVETLRAQELARSGLNLALRDLSDVIQDTEGRLQSADKAYRMAEGTVQLRISDEAGKIDVNHAPVEMLRPAMDALVARTDAFDANNIAQSIAALRSERGPFRSLDEVFLALDVPVAAQPAMRDVLTVHNYTPRIDPNSAGRLVLQSVPGLGEAGAADIIARRSTGRSLPAFGTAAVWLGVRDGPVYTVTAHATLSGGVQARMAATVRRTSAAFRGGQMNYEVLDWQVLP